MKIRYLFFLILLSSAWETSAQVVRQSDVETGDSVGYRDDIYIEDYKIRRVYLPFELHRDSMIRDTVPILRDVHIREYWEASRMSSGAAFAPSISMKLDDPMRVGPRLGFDSYIYRAYLMHEPRHYQSTVPLTNIYYSMGPKAEQEINGVHHHSLSPRFDFDIRYHKQNAPGFYSGERTNRSYFSATTYWSSKNLHWQNESYYRYVAMQSGQNGGLYTDTAYDDPSYNNLRLFETPFSDQNLQTLRNSSDFNDTHSGHIIGTKVRYIIGSTTKKWNADSTQQSYTLKPTQYLELDVHNDKQQYNVYYQNPDSAKLATLPFRGLSTLDTLGTHTELRNYTTRASYALALSSGARSSGLRVFGEYTYSLFDELSARSNVSVGGNFNFATPTAYLDANAQIYVAGYNVGDLSVDGEGRFEWKGFENIVRYDFKRSSVPYFYRTSAFNNLNVYNNLKAETRQNLEWQMRYKFLKAGLGVRSFYNYIYLQDDSNYLDRFRNHDVLANVYYATLGLRLDGKVFGADVDLHLQRVPSDFPIPVPAVLSSTKLFVHDSWFRDKLYFYTGFQLDLTSKYRSAKYDLFYNQYSAPVSATPEVVRMNLQYFFDFQISRAKLFLNFSQLNQLLGSNYTMGVVRDYSGTQAYNYIGSPNFNIHFGVSWLMIN